MLQSSKNSISRCSFEPRLLVQKIKPSIYEISRMWILILLILLIKLAHFETEVTFGSIWVNLQKRPILLVNFHLGYLKDAHFKHMLYFCSCCV